MYLSSLKICSIKSGLRLKNDIIRPKVSIKTNGEDRKDEERELEGLKSSGGGITLIPVGTSIFGAFAATLCDSDVIGVVSFSCSRVLLGALLSAI